MNGWIHLVVRLFNIVDFQRVIKLTLNCTWGYQQILLHLISKVDSCLVNERKKMPPWNQLAPWQITSILRWIAMSIETRVVQCLLARFNMWQARLERKGKLYHLDYINSPLQYYYPKVEQTPCQTFKKAFLCSIIATAWNSWMAIWTLHIEPEQEPLTDIGNLEPWKKDSISGCGIHSDNNLSKRELQGKCTQLQWRVFVQSWI